MSDFSGLVMAESSRLATSTDRYRNPGGGGNNSGGSGETNRDLYMDAQPLDFSTKKSHRDLLSLSSIDIGTKPGDTTARDIFNKAVAMSSIHPEPHNSAMETSPVPRSGCQPMSMSYSSLPPYPEAYR